MDNVKSLIMSRPQAGEVPPAPRQKKGKTCPGSHRSGDQRRGLLLPAHPALPLLGFPPRSRPGRGRRRLGRRQHPARVRQEGPSGKEGTTPTPAAATPGLSRRTGGPGPALGSSESGPPPRAARRGPPDGPAARPATQAGNSHQGCQEGGREWRGGAEVAPAPEGRGQAQARPRPCKPWNAGSAACLSGFPWASHFSFLSPSFPTSKMRLLIPALFLSLCDLRSVSFPSVPWFSYPENGATAMGHLH